MIRIFFPGQNVPDWLIKVLPDGEKYKPVKITFGGIVIVWNRKKQYFVRSITPVRLGTICVLEGANAVLLFMPPLGGNKMTYIMKPLLQDIFDLVRAKTLARDEKP